MSSVYLFKNPSLKTLSFKTLLHYFSELFEPIFFSLITLITSHVQIYIQNLTKEITDILGKKQSYPYKHKLIVLLQIHISRILFFTDFFTTSVFTFNI